ncbi:MAG: SCO family protein, partial [Anaerolineae bacterium]|nr:SCO family protein [Anaerolineae bacterium]
LPGQRLHGVPYTPARPAADLPLTDQFGQPFALRAQRGKVLAIYFGYTSCPDVCPLTLAQLTQVWRELTTEEADRFQPIFVTVDPERDTEAVMARYLSAFDNALASERPRGFIGLRGTPDALAQVLTAYGARAEKRPQPGSAVGYTMDHTASVFVVDAQGMLVEWFPYGAAVDHIVADVRYLLRRSVR